MFCFNKFEFTVQVKHKINSTQILGLILICSYFTTGHFHTCVLCKECSRYLPFLILGSVFSDCVVFYGDRDKRSDYQTWIHSLQMDRPSSGCKKNAPTTSWFITSSSSWSMAISLWPTCLHTRHRVTWSVTVGGKLAADLTLTHLSARWHALRPPARLCFSMTSFPLTNWQIKSGMDHSTCG